ncbi:YkgJ family cysteine cluster protein [Oceanidesulfovibrio marinus]|uniref:YkgJ family cysteine cluster protein n=1 Tax=Oceanidesulfovibrio marinus TaxID=370038 RepID=A0A6P1ZCM5_9BACT|nr:YkgJ family cysteine cluster protein [Oceanidesulfovibrio marinus]QJT09653.1 YkgJ family cysteine cluster protein [Oceanidesulfovibrio marinus]TVM31015.1 YkgJ family cysteine cluster protein [Oceanidesulfovibrio marinus]
MSERDETQAFLDSLPELKHGEQFCFQCHPSIECFNACCADLNLSLTPYDALRLRRALGEDSETFLTTRTDISTYPDTGYPRVHLRMRDDTARRPCPFVTEEGCSVYLDRPAACRTYPVGRATRVVRGGVGERFFVVREDHCQGFTEPKEWTPETWMADQGLEPYNVMNDRTMKLMAQQKSQGLAITAKQATMLLLALYQPDKFQKFVGEMGVFEHVEGEFDPQTVLADEETALGFGHDWAALILYGDHDRLQRKK